MEKYYNMIFKRKSMRKFDDQLTVSSDELNQIWQQLEVIKPLFNEIKTEFRIVKKAETTCNRGEYCLLMYSENKEGYLLNVGYMLEQVDLFLASINIGCCWYGFGKPKVVEDTALEFVIMLAFGKSNESDFRKDMFKSKRQPTEVIWQGDFNETVKNIVRYAPSSCNMQPWRVYSNDNQVKIYRTTAVNSIMPPSKRPYYNTIDMGIFLCFLEIIMDKQGIDHERNLNVQGDLDTSNIEAKCEVETMFEIGEYWIQ